ncbi:loganic acid O-methyltransferase-like [Fagus crenata]
MQNVIKAIVEKYQSLSPTSPLPEFQVFFNDQASNDFNTLFLTLPPERQYFAAGVAGSFHNRLFPESSLHFVHTSYSLHWLSILPEELYDKNSPAWNKGRVHYTSSPEEVYQAYSTQFAKDVENFLNARAKELVPGGMMVIIISGIPKGVPYSQIPAGMMYDLIASSLLDMATEGLISEDQVDSFNLPYYAASPDEMTGLVEKNGYFSIERMELTNPATWLEGPIDIRAWIMHVRAAMEGMFTKHFARETMDEIFERLIKKLSNYSELLQSRAKEKVQLFVVLKRN